MLLCGMTEEFPSFVIEVIVSWISHPDKIVKKNATVSLWLLAEIPGNVLKMQRYHTAIAVVNLLKEESVVLGTELIVRFMQHSNIYYALQQVAGV